MCKTFRSRKCDTSQVPRKKPYKREKGKMNVRVCGCLFLYTEIWGAFDRKPQQNEAKKKTSTRDADEPPHHRARARHRDRGGTYVTYTHTIRK